MNAGRVTLAALATLTLIAPLAGATSARTGAPLPIVFATGNQEEGNVAIAAVSSDGRTRRLLTPHPLTGSLVRWLRGGTKILFEATDESLWTVAADGTHVAHAPPDAQFGVSPNGRSAAYWTQGGDLVIRQRPERKLRVIREQIDWRTHIADAPSWSADGRFLVYDVESDATGAERVEVVRAVSDTPLAVAHVRSADPLLDLEWSTTSHTLALLDARNGELLLYDADTGRSRRAAVKAAVFQWSPNGRAIAYLGLRGGLYLVGADGGHPRRIAPTTPTAKTLAWGPDGHALVYGDDPGRLSAGRLYVVHIPSGQTRVLPPVGASDPAWWPGRRIAFEARGEIWTIDPAGRHPRPVTRVVMDVAPRWSPDGTKIAFLRSNDSTGTVVIIDAGGGHARVLARGFSPSWSPDSRRIVFRTLDGWIETIAADGSGLRSVVRGWAPSWSPRGDAIAFLVGDSLHVVAPDGTNDRKLLQRSFFPDPDPGNDEHYGTPVWSPDGSRIAVVAELVDSDKQRLDAVVGTVDAATGQTATLAHEDARQLAWSPDGAVIAATDDATAGIGLLAADGSGETVLVPRSGNFEYDSPVWSPDGSRLAYSRCNERADRCDISSIARAGGAQKDLTRGRGYDLTPTWRPSPQRRG